MKKVKKISLLVLSVLCILSASLTSFAGVWVKDSIGQYYENDGERVVDSIIMHNGDVYGVDEDGYMLTNWWLYKPRLDSAENVWYYFQSSGKALKDTTKMIDKRLYIFDQWYLIDAVGLFNWNDNLYYGVENMGGAVERNKLITVGGLHYWFKDNGAAAKNEYVIIGLDTWFFDDTCAGSKVS